MAQRLDCKFVVVALPEEIADGGTRKKPRKDIKKDPVVVLGCKAAYFEAIRNVMLETVIRRNSSDRGGARSAG